MLLIRAGLIMLAGGAAATSPGGDCLPDWSEAVQTVRQLNLATLEELGAARSNEIGGQVVKSTLCRNGRGYFYRLVVRDGHGRLRSVTLDATRAATPPTKR